MWREYDTATLPEWIGEGRGEVRRGYEYAKF
jgi:hypothetical protein